MKIEAEKVDDLLLITLLEPKLDANSGAKLKAQISSHLQEDISDVIVNLSAVQFIDSSGLGSLVICSKTFGPKVRIALSGTPLNVRYMFRMTRMDRIFRLFETNDDAIVSLSQQSVKQG